MTMNNENFIAALREAKVLALKNYKYENCIRIACYDARIQLGYYARFGEGTEYEDLSVLWARNTNATKADIARVFDKSIKALEGK